MRKVTLFIAMSLDGYIADYQGKVVVMGWNTYNQIVTELSPDKWIYNELTTSTVLH